MKKCHEIHNCSDCPLRQHHSGHGENWDYCSHPNGPGGYGAIINKDDTHALIHPEWCPLLKEALEIEYKIIEKGSL